MRNNYLFGKSRKAGRYFIVCLLILGGFWTTQSYAQITAANYTFSTSTTGSLGLDMNGNTIDMTTGTTTLVAAGTDDTPVSPITNITFNFTLVSTTYSQFSVSSNGMLWLCYFA